MASGRDRGRRLDHLDHRRAADVGDLDVRAGAPGAAGDGQRRDREHRRDAAPVPGAAHGSHRRLAPVLHLRLVVPTEKVGAVLDCLSSSAAVTNVVHLPGAALEPAG